MKPYERDRRLADLILENLGGRPGRGFGRNDAVLDEPRERAPYGCDDPACSCHNDEVGRCDLCGAGPGEACICALRRRATATVIGEAEGGGEP